MNRYITYINVVQLAGMLWSSHELGVQLEHVLFGEVTQIRWWLPMFRAVGLWLSL